MGLDGVHRHVQISGDPPPSPSSGWPVAAVPLPSATFDDHRGRGWPVRRPGGRRRRHGASPRLVASSALTPNLRRVAGRGGWMSGDVRSDRRKRGGRAFPGTRTDSPGGAAAADPASGTTSSVPYRRATMLLTSACGNRAPVIAQLVQAHEDTVRDVTHRSPAQRLRPRTPRRRLALRPTGRCRVPNGRRGTRRPGTRKAAPVSPPAPGGVYAPGPLLVLDADSERNVTGYSAGGLMVYVPPSRCPRWWSDAECPLLTLPRRCDDRLRCGGRSNIPVWPERRVRGHHRR